MNRNDTTTADDASLELLTVDDLSRLLKRSRASLHRDLSANRLPRPIKLGSAVRWRRQSIVAWLDQAENENARRQPGVDGSDLAQHREAEQ
jgi:predicted DNA-binding transcriptional regulator AlpA